MAKGPHGRRIEAVAARQAAGRRVRLVLDHGGFGGTAGRAQTGGAVRQPLLA
ncbi:MAG: hypothetical protein ACK4TJ_03585 [Tabrizicola sp.]